MYYNIIISFLIRSSEEMYTHLENTLASAECNSNVGQGKLYVHIQYTCMSIKSHHTVR